MTAVYALVGDLMDRSRIQSGLGRTVGFVRRVEDLAGSDADVVLADLRSVPHPERLRALLPDARIVAFGSHVDEEVLEAARRAGLDEVLPRSVFFRRLDRLLG